MIRATLRMRVRPGAEDAFERAWDKVAEATARSPHNLRQALLREPGDSVYVITSDWATLAAFRDFEQSPEQDRLTARLRELRESAEMTVNQIVQHVDARTAGEENTK
ncbi:antibiotic biosynthesis monooxygenase family protein [Spirillospora sp. CA-294931]|uniref:antibiotic biosynthesis monooxygenase family protein n=1 Tax=Spirillospora sp. CA-294931 TaxID=3240042 RepID=UPI003D89E863